MLNPIIELVTLLQKRGAVLQMKDGKLRCRGPITAEEKRLLTLNAPIVAAILEPDETLPDEIYIPREVPNTIEAISSCVDSQRIRRAA